ncbi:hypothetical protein NE237_022969 [Protea cynaroides]|uniref:Uncharacterized protein n=1 Tax=Protea cynaroides TaxID=273540 RepID=A0A9Q0HBZ8_9MAGN|nr:hypothetical protein NE237_022969 [Protea cynaroides]
MNTLSTDVATSTKECEGGRVLPDLVTAIDGKAVKEVDKLRGCATANGSIDSVTCRGEVRPLEQRLADPRFSVAKDEELETVVVTVHMQKRQINGEKLGRGAMVAAMTYFISSQTKPE